MPPLRPYADRPLRCTVQVVTDLFALAWTAMWVLVAVIAHRVVVALAAAGYRLRDAADAAAGHLRDAADGVANVPFAGDSLASPLRSAGSATADIADAWRGLADGVASAALPVAVVIVVTTVLPLAVPWVLLRARYARQAGATARLATSEAGARLLALRALANAPAQRLLRLADDPVAAWTCGNDEVITGLVALELRRVGLHADHARVPAGEVPRLR